MKGVAYAFAALVALFGALTQVSAGCYGECNGYQDNRSGYGGGPGYYDDRPAYSNAGYYDNGPRGHTVYYERGPEYFVGGYERPTYRGGYYNDGYRYGEGYRYDDGYRGDDYGYGTSYVVAAGIQLLAVPFAVLARRENAPSDPITESPEQPEAAAA